MAKHLACVQSQSSAKMLCLRDGLLDTGHLCAMFSVVTMKNTHILHLPDNGLVILSSPSCFCFWYGILALLFVVGASGSDMVADAVMQSVCLGACRWLKATGMCFFFW